jgi:hypothetical protein
VLGGVADSAECQSAKPDSPLSTGKLSLPATVIPGTGSPAARKAIIVPILGKHRKVTKVFKKTFFVDDKEEK